MRRYIHEILTQKDIDLIQSFFGTIRKTYGPHWGFIIDLKDNIAQVLRCVYYDTGASGYTPVTDRPLIGRLSWRVTTMEEQKPVYFEKLDMNDPRSFFLRKSSIGEQQFAFLPIQSDSNIGLLTMMSTSKDAPLLAPRDLEMIDKAKQELAPLLETLLWKLEQRMLNTAVSEIRGRELPKFVCQLFSRLLEAPVLFIKKLKDSRYQALHHFGMPDEETNAQNLLFDVPIPRGTVFYRGQWRDMTDSPLFGADQIATAVYLKPGNAMLLVVGEIRLRGPFKNDLFDILAHVEKLMEQRPYQVSTLTFLLHLQHWVRSGDRDINKIFQTIVDSLMPIVNADFGTLALLDREKKRMIFASQAGEWVNPLNNLPLVQEDGEPSSILAWVAKENKPYVAGDVSKDPYYKAFNPSIRSEMCVPVRVRGEIIGLFSVSSSKLNQFQSEEVARLQFFSDQIGISLYQAGILDRAMEQSETARKLDQEIRFGFHTRTHAKDLDYNFGNLVGSQTGAMAEVFKAIHRINQSGRDDLNVLIQGETGCGKEMVSFAIHNSSWRHKRPMIVANFASFGGDPNLIQSELFGHEKGSFSGASARRIGCIEQAHNSTLLIDEVGDIVSSVQIKLLRVLQQGDTKTFQRLGGQENIESNVRILAATHKNFENEVREGRFREDLYYRLNTLVIRIPSLRERLEDVPLLAAHFTAKIERQVKDFKLAWTKGGVEALQDYDWPGNVRQLEAVINRASVLYADEGRMTREAIEASLEMERNPAPREESLFKRVLEAGEGAFWELVQKPYRKHQITREDVRNLVRASLTHSRGSYKQAAAAMGVAGTDYNKFLDFLKNCDSKLDYRQFRK